MSQSFVRVFFCDEAQDMNMHVYSSCSDDNLNSTKHFYKPNTFLAIECNHTDRVGMQSVVESSGIPENCNQNRRCVRSGDGDRVVLPMLSNVSSILTSDELVPISDCTIDPIIETQVAPTEVTIPKPSEKLSVTDVNEISDECTQTFPIVFTKPLLMVMKIF